MAMAAVQPTAVPRATTATQPLAVGRTPTAVGRVTTVVRDLAADGDTAAGRAMAGQGGAAAPPRLVRRPARWGRRRLAGPCGLAGTPPIPSRARVRVRRGGAGAVRAEGPRVRAVPRGAVPGMVVLAPGRAAQWGPAQLCRGAASGAGRGTCLRSGSTSESRRAGPGRCGPSAEVPAGLDRWSWSRIRLDPPAADSAGGPLRRMVPRRSGGPRRGH